ncbi:MAG: sulfatase-like hydrolase/transferase [Anaerolineales bacterium]|nr:sulfatase-like hydrolase/transferase [Anaerolineales bacterium]
MQPPNILIVMTDHQRGDTVLPEHPAITPTIDRFAREGISFSEAFCPSPHCCPSRATFFTGLYPSRHGVWNNVCNDQALSRGLNDGIRLWSEDLAEAGYQLHFCGKWHLSVEESPQDRGWREHFVSAAAGTHHGAPWTYYQKVAAQPAEKSRKPGEILRPGYGRYRLYGIADDNGEEHDETAVAKAIEVLESVSEESQPWCLYVGLIGPHDPYDVPQKYLDLYDLQEVPLPASYSDDMVGKPGIYQRMRNQIFGQLSDKESRDAIRHFWAYCTYLDDLFGQILEALDKSGQQENTLVLYCADHGDYCGEHGLFTKGIPCFRGAYHLPAIIRWPQGITDPGRQVDAFVSLADFAPTFLEVAGLPPDRNFTGASLLPFLHGRVPDNWRDDIHTQCNGVELYYTQRSVTTKDFKYTFNGFDFDELYDLRVDPDEMNNLVDDPEYEAVKGEMCARMWRFAYQEADSAINPYITVGLAPYGPAEAFREK